MFKNSKLVLAILLCKIVLTLCEIKIVPEVTVQEGTLRGATLISRAGRKYHAFRGIRYAEPPERFKIAEPPKRWEGVRDAIEVGDACTQRLPSSVGALLGTIGTEDCLYIHVFTPHENQDQKLPVMFWIHGGAFIFGYGDQFGSPYMLDEDIVLVTFNYRLAAFGFLYNEDDLIPGNLGLRDQVEALKWVKRNIHHFGGDPNQVTIFGESAGAVSVHFMLLSQMAKGLFHRAIMMSGSAIAPWAVTTNPKFNCEKLAAAVECPTGNKAEMIECLRTIDTEAIAEVAADSRWSALPEYHWAPVIERSPNLNPADAFIAEKPLQLLERKQIVNNVPVIMGVMKNEGAAIFSGFILQEEDTSHEMDSNWTGLAPLAFFYLNERMEIDPRHSPATAKIREFYFDHHTVGHETEQRLTDLFSDRYFIHGAYKTAKFHAEMAPTYLYLFTYSIGTSILNAIGIKKFDPPSHCDDVPYLFPFTLKETLADRETGFSKRFVKLWASFAITGEPSATWGDAPIWPMTNISDRSLTWYRLDERTQLLSDPYINRIKFWDDLLANELKD